MDAASEDTIRPDELESEDSDIENEAEELISTSTGIEMAGKLFRLLAIHGFNDRAHQMT